MAGPPPAAVHGVRGRLAALCDPEWLWFLGFGLVPAALCAGFGDLQRASFFFGAAVFASVLKWLGRLLLGPGLNSPRPELLFPAELFAGLAAACAWFYLRNAVGALWPASYGLREFAVLAPLAGAAHLLAAAPRLSGRWAGWRAAARAALTRAPLYAPFWGALTVALWQVSGSLNPQTQDPIFHACAARAYVETGLFRPHPFLHILAYPSGFGAVNAVAASVAPLTVAQAVNLQHVLWLVAVLYLLAATPALLAGRWFRGLGLAPLVFLAVVPLYALVPDFCYTGTPRQMAAALLPAVVLLPLLAPPRGAYALSAGAAAAVLGALAAAMNPAVVPFAALALALALAVGTVRARRAGGGSVVGALVGRVVPVLLAGLLVAGCDPYCRAQVDRARAALRPADGALVAGDAAPATGGAGGGPFFSVADGLRALTPAKVLTLAENATLTPPAAREMVVDWPERSPYRFLPLCGLLAVGVLAGLVAACRRRGTALPPGVAPLAAYAIGCLAVWLTCKLAVAFAVGGLHGDGYEVQMLRAYLGFLLLRAELLLLFAVLCAVGPALLLAAGAFRGRWRSLLPLAYTTAGLLTALAALFGAWPRTGFCVVPATSNHMTTPDDLALVAWCDEHVPADKGLIGMAALQFRAGPNRVERHLVGLGGVPGFLLYGKQGNYCFTVTSLDARSWYDAYGEHVGNDFDPDWCLENGVRYFYLTPLGLEKNPGLARAVERGQLRLLHAVGESAIYEVVGERPPRGELPRDVLPRPPVSARRTASRNT